MSTHVSVPVLVCPSDSGDLGLSFAPLRKLGSPSHFLSWIFVTLLCGTVSFRIIFSVIRSADFYRVDSGTDINDARLVPMELTQRPSMLGMQCMWLGFDYYTNNITLGTRPRVAVHHVCRDRMRHSSCSFVEG